VGRWGREQPNLMAAYGTALRLWSKIPGCAMLTRMTDALFSLYIHIPFCRHRCGYCDFNTTAGMERLIPRYIEALREEIRIVLGGAGKPLRVHTIFFGGGTPSLVPPEDIGTILDEIREHSNVLPEAEISLEANPGTVAREHLEELRSRGVNRLSFGMQSANPEELRALERQHNIYDVFRAVEWSRKAGFDNINLDLIFGLPGQSLERWEKTLETAILMKPEHLSLYALTVEEGTPLHDWVRRGLVAAPEDDLAADMYELAGEKLARGGFRQYEISNWAVEGPEGDLKACRHNLQYWRNEPYLGFGAGAHGCAESVRTENISGLHGYLQKRRETSKQPFPAGPATVVTNRLSPEVERQETMMVGLRLTEEGVGRKRFFERFGCSIDEIFHTQLDALIRTGLLEWGGESGDNLRLTKRGRLLGNRVFMEFAGED
jgi:oxygen-independent coproporphyrinogen-3 oxidase